MMFIKSFYDDDVMSQGI